MASKKEQQSSPPGGLTNPQKVSQLSHSVPSAQAHSYSGALQVPTGSKIPEDVKSLGMKFADLFQKELAFQESEASKKAIPYYTDVKTNKFSVLSVEDSVVETDPFNTAAAAFIASDKPGEVFRFKDDHVSAESQALLQELAIYIHKIKHVNFNYRVENGVGTRSDLFRKVNNYMADLYWEYKEQLPSVLIPKDLLAKYLDKKVNVTAKMTYNHRSLLYSAIRSMNTGENSDRMANGWCHLIKSAFEAGYARDANYFFEKLIKEEKRFTPSITMLSIKGYVPDVKVGRYMSLFLSSEQAIIKESAISKAEASMQLLFRTAVTADTLHGFIKNLRDYRKIIEDDLLSVEIRRVRKERLLIAGNMKKDHRGKAPFSLRHSVGNKLSDPRVREAFNPFRLAFASKQIETAPGQAITVIRYDDASDFYRYTSNEYNDALDRGRVKAIGLEFVAYLE